MATSYNRRINLYINGKEVRNDIASIKGEMNKLINEQARMTIGSKEYVARAAEIRKLKGILTQHQADLASTSKGWLSLSKMADKFNKYQSLFLGFVGSFAGVVLSVKSAVNAYAEFEDKLADVMKTTGLTRDQVESLNDELKKIDTRTSQQDLLDLARVAGKLGISAESDILEFVRAADKIRVALSEDLGGDVEESINQIGKLVDIFKLKPEFGIEQSMLKVGSAINALGAAGTASEAYLVEFAKRVAGVAPAAGISIEAVLGLGATLDELGQTSEVAATVYNQVMTGMFKDTELYAGTAGMSVKDFTDLLNNDANEAFIRVLEGANKSGKGFGDLAKSLDKLGLDGARATGVLGVLAGNTEKLRQKQAYSNQEFEKGTSLLNEFNVKNNTAQAQLEKAKKKFAEISIELGEKLTPAFTAVISKARLMLDIISGVTSILIKYGGIILTTAVSITAYTVAAKLATLWTVKYKEATIASVISGKLNALAFNAQFAAISLYNTAIALFNGRIKIAAIQFRAFSAALKANPIGLILGAITAVVGGLILLARNLDKTTAAQKAMNDVEITAQQNIAEQRIRVQELIKLAKADTVSLETRKKALEELNKISPEYFGNLTLETIKTDAAKKASDGYTESLLRNAKVIAAREKLVEIEKERIAAEIEGDNHRVKTLQMLWNSIKSFGSASSFAYNQAATATGNATKKQDEYNKKVDALGKIIDKNANNINAIAGPAATPPVIPPSPPPVPPGGPDKDDKNAAKTLATRLKAVNSANAAELKSISDNYTKKQITETQYNEQRKTQELKHLSIKLAILQKGSTEYAAVEKRYAEINAADKQTAFDNETALLYVKYADQLAAAKGNAAKIKEAERALADGIVEIRLKGIESANDREIAEIEKRHTENKISDNQYKGELLAQELKYWSDKLAILDKGSNEYARAEAEYNKKKGEVQRYADDQLLQAQQMLSDAKIDSIKDDLDKEIAIEKQQWKDELSGLEQQLIKKQQLSDKEVEINKTLNDTIEKRTKQHNQKMAELNSAKALQEQMDEALIAQAKAGTTKQEFEARTKIAEAAYAAELASAQGNAVKIAQAERKHSDDIKQIKADELQAKIAYAEQFSEVTAAASNLVNTLMNFELEKAGENEEKKAQIRKKYANIQFAVTASQIIVDTAAAIMKALAQLGPIGGPIAAAIMGATGAAQLAIANAERKKMFSGEGYSEGGYTGPGPEEEPAGVVHKGEYVVPAWQVKAPYTWPILDELERARKTTTTVNPDLVRGRVAFQTGGYITKTSHAQQSSGTLSPNEKITTSGMSEETARELTDAIRKLTSWKPKVYTELIKKDLDTLESINKNSKM